MNNDDKPTLPLEAHLREWHEIADRLRSQMLQTGEAIQKSMRPIVEARDALHQALVPILAQQQERWQQIIDSFSSLKIDLPDLSLVTKQFTDFQKAIQGSIGPAFQQLQKGFAELPARTRDALLLLGEHGWYLDPEMSLPALWKLTLSEGDLLGAESALAEYFEGRVTEIEESIVTAFPHRSHITRAAFNAHRKGEYELSVPVLLAQADGICKETVDQYLFLKHNKKPRTAIYVAQFAAGTFMM